MPSDATMPPAELLSAFAEGDALAGMAIADVMSERGEEALAAGWRWVARAGRFPRECTAAVGMLWYWAINPGTPPDTCRVSWRLLERLAPSLRSPADYADYPTPVDAILDLAQAAGALLGGRQAVSIPRLMLEWRLPSGVILTSILGRPDAAPEVRRAVSRPFIPYGADAWRVAGAADWLPLRDLPPAWGLRRLTRDDVKALPEGEGEEG